MAEVGSHLNHPNDLVKIIWSGDSDAAKSLFCDDAEERGKKTQLVDKTSRLEVDGEL